MGKMIESREPLTRAEVLEYLNKNVEAKAKQWGEDYIYTEWARRARDKKLAQFDNGEVVEVYTVGYCDSYGNGTGNYEDVLMSDGTVKTCCYGYYD